MTTAARPDTEVVFDPATYTRGVPFDALARLRRDTPVAWVAEIPVLGWPEGSFPHLSAGGSAARLTRRNVSAYH